LRVSNVVNWLLVIGGIVCVIIELSGHSLDSISRW
jgi:hypothetical protein